MRQGFPKILWPILLLGAGVALIAGSLLVDLERNQEVARIPASSPTAAPNSEVNASPQVGSRAPSFMIENVAGELVALEDFEGRVVMLNFWATWCAPCQLEMPDILEVYENTARDQFIVLAINDRETKQAVMGFANQFKLTFPLLLDAEGEVQRLYRVPGLPTSVFIDKEGIIQGIHIGILTEDQLQKNLLKAGLEV